MKRSAVVTAVLLVAIVGSAAFANGQVATGITQFGRYGGGPLDSVNLGNLNVHFAIPIFHKAGRGLPFAFDLSYDSSIWQPVTASGTTTWTPVTNIGGIASYWGWQQLTSVTPYVSYQMTYTSGNCGQYGNSSYQAWQFSSFVYYDAHGGSHSFAAGGSYYNSPGGQYCPPGGAQPANGQTMSATDGSNYSINVQFYAGYASGTIVSSNGTVFGVPWYTTATPSPAPWSQTDSNGNEINYNNNTGVFTDTLNTSALTVQGSAPGTTTFTYTAPSGAPAAYSVTYKSYTVQTNFGCSGVRDVNLGIVYLVDRVTLPDNSFYQFGYEGTAGASSGQVTGRLASVQLPTGGTIKYTYQNNGQYNGINCSDGSAPVESSSSTPSLTRVVSAGSNGPNSNWTYSRTAGTNSSSITTMIDANGNQSVLQFVKDSAVSSNTLGFYETQGQFYQKISGVQTLQSIVTKCYNGNYANCVTNAVASPITQMDTYTQPQGGSTRLSQVIFSAGLVTDDKEYDFGAITGAAPGNTHLIRETATAYALGGKPASVNVYDWSSGQQVLLSSTAYYYDGAYHGNGATLSPTSGIPQHVSPSGPRGNLTTIATQVNGTTTLYRQFTYDDTGMMTSSTGPDTNGLTICSGSTSCTTYSYSSGGSCQNAFVTEIQEPIQQPVSLSRSMAWNCTGGVQTSVTDENGNTSTSNYTQDPDFWRPESSKDASQYVTNYTYTPSTVESSLSFGASVVDQLTTVDTLGRPHVAQSRLAPGSLQFDSVETDYDPVGNSSQVSMPYQAESGVAAGSNFTVTSTDVLGRPIQVTDAGGGQVKYSYSANDVLIQNPASGSETQKQRQLEYDGLGRLSSVCEISATLPGSGTCAQNSPQQGYWTKYTYDALGHLLTVTQNAQASSGHQQRTFTYDELGRMLTEVNPENGTTTYIYDSDSACTPSTSGGDLIKIVDAVGNVTCHGYDGLHRQTSITYPSGSYASVTPDKYFIYDSGKLNGTTSMNSPAGRMIEAYTVLHGTGKTGAKVTDEWFSYSARGEVIAVYEMTPNSGGYYTVGESYFANGAVSSIAASGVPTVTYGLDGAGRPLTASDGTHQLVANSSYNSAGSPVTIEYGNGDKDSCFYDANSNRMTGYVNSVRGSCPASFAGAMTWNPVGTLAGFVTTDSADSTKNQSCSYQTDDLGRSSSVSCTSWSQSFTYDAFGNIQKTGNQAFTPGYLDGNGNTNNRIQSGYTVGYDANGNSTNDGLNGVYTWDADNHTVSISNIVSIPKITYDALGRTVEISLGGSTYKQIVYGADGSKLAVWQNASTLLKATIPLPGDGTAVYNSSGFAYFRHPDWLGSSRLATKWDHTIYSKEAYAPFGELETSLESGTIDRSFTGQDQDTVATGNGLYDFLYRRYHPTQGRWISPDPAGGAASNPMNPQSWNRYAYVGNNPLVSIDPLGLQCVTLDNGVVGDDGTDPPCESMTQGNGPDITVTSTGLPSWLVGALSQFAPLWGYCLSNPSSCGINIPTTAIPPSSGPPSIWQRVEQKVHDAICQVGAPLVGSAKASNGVNGVGVGGGGAVGLIFGAAAAFGVQVVADPNANIGLVTNANINPGVPPVVGLGANGGYQVSHTFTNSIYNLEGYSATGSVGAGPVSVDVSAAQDGTIGINVTYGPATPFNFRISGQPSLGGTKLWASTSCQGSYHDIP